MAEAAGQVGPGGGGCGEGVHQRGVRALQRGRDPGARGPGLCEGSGNRAGSPGCRGRHYLLGHVGDPACRHRQDARALIRPAQARQHGWLARKGSMMAYLLQRLLTDAAVRQPQRPAVASDGCLISYQELDGLSNKVARALLRLGVAPGDRVGILAPKSAAAVIGLYGTLKAGASYVPLDPKAPAGRLCHIVRDSGATVMMTDEVRSSEAA